MQREECDTRQESGETQWGNQIGQDKGGIT